MRWSWVELGGMGKGGGGVDRTGGRWVGGLAIPV